MGNKHSRSLHQTSNRPGSVESITDESIESFPYFFSDLSREQAEAVMNRHIDTPDSFLIRASSKQRSYAITIVIAGNRIGHAIIHSPRNGLFYAEEDVPFEKFSDLVKYYHDVPLPNFTQHDIAATLKYPVYKFRKPMPLHYQEHAILYSTGDCSDLVYNTVGEHLALNRRSRSNGQQRFSVFWDDDKQITLPLPPSAPCRGMQNPALICDETSPKLTFSQPAVPQNEYLSPTQLNEVANYEHPPVSAKRTSLDEYEEYLYLPMDAIFEQTQNT